MSLLGLDVGTTGCKAAAFSEAGACLADAYREYPTLHPQPGWAELDSRQVLARVWECLAEVARQTAQDPVTALSISSMGEAMTPVTRDRRILGNSILSSDTRGQEYVDALAEKLGREAFYAINPNLLGPQYSLPKLLWMRDHRPEEYHAADHFLLWGDLVAFMLGCEPATSYSLANRTLLFDIRKEEWSPELLGLAGIERERLPAPRPSGTAIGTISRAAAGELGLPAGVQVIVGGHDQCCNSLGAGVTRAGSAICGIGTYECITPTYDRIPDAGPMLASGLNVEHHVLPGLYVSFLYNQAGSLVRWFRDTFAAADRQLAGGGDLYDALTAEMPEAPTSLFVLPYFEITGPPGFVADASGAVLGLTTSTTRGEILKGILEGTALYFVESLQALRAMKMDTSAFIATGGGARSDRWLQIKADIFGVPIIRPRITEASILGAAMLAGLATGAFAGPEEAAARFVRHERVFEPDAGRHRQYQEKLAVYRGLFPLLGETLRWRMTSS